MATIVPTGISNTELGSSVRTKLNNLILSSNAAENMGFSLTDAEANKTALDNLMNVGNGGTAIFGPYTYPMTWATTFNRPVHEPIALIGVKGLTRFTFNHSTVSATAMFDLRDSNIVLKGIIFECSGLNADRGAAEGKALVNYATASMTSNIALVHIEDCQIIGFETGVKSPTAEGLNRVKSLMFLNNIVRCRSGAIRAQGTITEFARVEGNDIDGAVPFGENGCMSGYGGIVIGYIQNDGSGNIPDEMGDAVIRRNTVRNIRPTVDPGSAGCYGILFNGRSAEITDNLVVGVHQFFGTATSATLATGDGTTKIFTGTLASLPLPHSFRITAGSISGTSQDQGPFRPGKQKVTGTGLGTTGAAMSWIDANTGQWRLEFTTAPANGQAITGDWLVLISIVDNIEGIYVKASRSYISGNRLRDCAGTQGMMGLKGGGSQNGIDPDGILPYNAGGGNLTAQTGPYEGGPNSALGCQVIGNRFINQFYKGLFADSRAIWIQTDYVLIANNYFENISGRLIRCNVPSRHARVLKITDNIVKNYRGTELVYAIETWHGLEINGLTVDGLKPNSGTTVSVFSAALAADEHLYHCKINNINILGGNDIGGNAVNTATTVNMFKCNDATGSYTDVKISDISSRLSWRMEEKTGASTMGKRVFRDYSVENNAQNATIGSTTPTRQFLNGGTATANIGDDGGHL